MILNIKYDLSTGIGMCSNNKMLLIFPLIVINLNKKSVRGLLSLILFQKLFALMQAEKNMRITALILASLFSVGAFAEIYKCTDTEGKTDYQSIPCKPEFKTEQINIKTGTADDRESEQQALEQKKQDEKSEQELTQRREAQLKQDAIDESAKNQFVIKNNPDKFSVFAIPPYALDDLPDLVKNHQNRLPDIERFRRVAAEKALATGACVRVEASILHRKSTKKHLTFSVTCSSGKDFYFTEQELTQQASR